MAKIGFIGLGHMGLPMALNLLKADHEVTGFDKQSEAVNRFVEAGGRAATTLTTLAQDQDVLITMLQTGEQVASVCLGETGVFEHVPLEALFIDCSSIEVEMSRNITQAAIQAGLLAIDAPVSGGVAAASAATLTFMVGGDSAAFEKAQPILFCMGKRVIHAGREGSGQIAKLCNNLILGVSMIAVSEAFTLAERLGLAPNKLFEIVNEASGQCWVMSHYVPVPGVLPNVPANDGYQAGFTAAMMLKDLRLSQDAADAAHVDTPMGFIAMRLYEELVRQGSKDLDFSAIIQLITAGEKQHA